MACRCIAWISGRLQPSLALSLHRPQVPVLYAADPSRASPSIVQKHTVATLFSPSPTVAHTPRAGGQQPAEEEQEQDQPEAAEEVDVQARVAAAPTRIMGAAGPPPATEALEEEDQRRVSDRAHDAMEQD